MNGVKTGEMVFYPFHGVGLLKEKVTRPCEDKQKNYLKVYFHELKMEIFIPVDSAEQKGIRALTSRETLEKSKKHFFKKYNKLPLLASERKKSLDRKLKSGEVLNIIEVIRDLVCASQYDLRLGFQDKQLLEVASNLLKDELMHVLNLSSEEVSEILKRTIKSRSKNK
ncbi:CarD family transcriptional regulator [Paenibacillus sp. USHLN196]|uniref:CarD family transcriptional regulator n=1 Tax=Paenibacillus sp. USHLN196 TaxID=3081291 RepID=UPI0030175E70